ncbi:DNA starvation/stationary phase protection protein DpsA [Leptolyngbya sp. FACHB-261]|uniref:DNA starvation/stationary phase protection protein DpsA n=1 Tax=Leptolyngbya sp. FACHB-261 TaxID=2692806 RepID=UPI001689281F|nr:DNA starvation/stationary phase protection protein DpsA [Leptolyngbya sp. FACHB-261]MBD2100733.1 DNA starvation/stationary phase protection protein [Leptolyngbya sp. FACHB-261]
MNTTTNHSSILRQAPDVIADNVLRLERDLAGSVVNDLNPLLGSLFTLFHQYQKHHWVVTGPQFGQLHDFLKDGYSELHDQADKVAERITALGGVPVSTPARQQELACFETEPEGVFDLRQMLEHDLNAEGDIISMLRVLIRRFNGLGDFASEQILREIIVEREEYAHHLEHYLALESLTRAMHPML